MSDASRRGLNRRFRQLVAQLISEGDGTRREGLAGSRSKPVWDKG